MAWRLRPIAGTGANESDKRSTKLFQGVAVGKMCMANLSFQKLLVPKSSWRLHVVFFNVSRLKLWSWCSVCISLLGANAFFNVFSAVLSVTVAECGVSQQLQTMHLFTCVLSWLCYPFGKISDGISQVIWPHGEKKQAKLHISMPRPPPHGPSERPQANHPRSTHPLIQHLQANRICDTRASTSGGGNGGGTGNIVPPGATRALLELLL